MKKARVAARVTDGDGVQRSRRYWTVAEFCEVVDRSPYTAQRWRSEGGGPPYLKVGGRVLYDEEVVHEWCASHEQNSTSDYEIVDEDEEQEQPTPAPVRRYDTRLGRTVVDRGGAS
jgi:hypothetical protein